MEQHRGKMICKVLKDIRMQIAQENDIEFVTSECTHKGDCAGTCPRCEAEVRYLESQLARHRSVGRTVRLTGLSLGLAAMAPALISCSPDMGDLPVTDGLVQPPLIGDPAIPENVALGENLIFDIIAPEVFMEVFSKGGWQETEAYEVFPGGKLGENILKEIVGVHFRKYAVKSENTIKQYLSYDAEPEVFGYKILPLGYDGYANGLWIGTYPDDFLTLTVASIDENEMVCYGQPYYVPMNPEAFLVKYVFKHVSDETVAQWDEKYASELKEQ